MRCKNCRQEVDLRTACQDFCSSSTDKDESLDVAESAEELRVARDLLMRLQDELISRENYVTELKNTLEVDRQQWVKKERQYLGQIDDLKKQMCLERNLKVPSPVPYSGENQYKTTPVLIHKGTSRAYQRDGTGMFGIAILDDELFVLSQRSHDIEVYDAETFTYKHSFQQTEIVNPLHIEACSKLNCLFVVDGKYSGEQGEILRIDAQGNILGRWYTGDAWGMITVTSECNVLMTESEHGKIIEYSPDGQILNEIVFQPKSGIKHPWHAIKLTSDHFIVSHGYYKDESMHRVCIVNRKGDILKSYGGMRGSERGSLNMPLCLAMDSSGLVFVVELGNKRILLLNSKLEFQRELISTDHGLLKFPTRMCLDETRGRLLITENRLRDGRCVESKLLVFRIRQ